MVMEEYGGRIPDRVEDLLRLPGIGDYTAGAVASIAYGRRAAAVDGNVLRVFARLTACRDDILRPAVKKRASGMVAGADTGGCPGIFNQAVMELGETVCLPNTEPLCAACPVRPFCRGSAGGSPGSCLSVPQKARRVEHRLILVVVTEEKNAPRPAPPPTWQGPAGGFVGTAGARAARSVRTIRGSGKPRRRKR